MEKLTLNSRLQVGAYGHPAHLPGRQNDGHLPSITPDRNVPALEYAEAGDGDGVLDVVSQVHLVARPVDELLGEAGDDLPWLGGRAQSG